MILDSNFLIHLERERRKRISGPAGNFLLSHASEKLFITPTIAGEIASGISMSDRRIWSAFTGVFPALEITNDVSWEFGNIYRELRTNGTLIGQNDLWIAATGIAYNETVVTRNVSEFGRVPGLRVQSF